MDPDRVTESSIQTFTGEMFDIYYPDPEKINLPDIAHALSMLCRYGGHSRNFYSVAEHSVMMADYFDQRGEQDLARVALLHDATEAYMGDLVRPLKMSLSMVRYREVEAQLQAVIYEKFRLPPEHPLEVKDADLRICNDERVVLMLPRPWTIDGLLPLGVDIQCWSPIQAEQIWADTFWRLFL